jgi:hypothetical protein
VSAQEAMMALTNIDGILKRDSNDCLVKDIEKKRNGKVGCEKTFFESSALVKVGIGAI